MILTKHQKVGSTITDPTSNLSVIGVFQIAEEAVTELMGDLKIDGITAKREYNAVWVFAKNKTEIYKSLAWNEEYTVNCFISKTTLAFICIDVAIKNRSDELCAYSKLELCALDLQSGKIRKVTTVGVSDQTEIHPPLADVAYTRFTTEDLPEADKVKVKYTNIDFVGHTNNKEYVRFILDTYSVRELEEKPVREMEIIYNNQSYENDILSVYKGGFQGTDILEIKKDDKTIVQCKILRGHSE